MEMKRPASADGGGVEMRRPASADGAVKLRPAIKLSGHTASTSSKSSASGIDVQFKVDSRVSIWSATHQKWFDDGQVTKVTQDGMDVQFNEKSLEKMVPWQFVAEKVKLLKPHEEPVSFKLGDSVSVWSVKRREWIHDGVVMEINSTDVRIVGDHGQMESCVPHHLTSEFVILNDEAKPIAIACYAAAAEAAAAAPKAVTPSPAALPILTVPSKRLQEANARWQQHTPITPFDEKKSGSGPGTVTFAAD